MVFEGLPLKDVMRRYPDEFAKNRSLVMELRYSRTIGRSWPMEVTAFYGPGWRHELMRERFMDAFVLPDCPLRKEDRWTGYDGQGTVIMTPSRGFMTMDEFSDIVGSQPLDLRVGRSYVKFVAKRILLILDTCPEEWFDRPFRLVSHRVDRWMYRPFQGFEATYFETYDDFYKVAYQVTKDKL